LFSLSVLLRSSSSQSTRYLFILPGNIRFASFSYSFVSVRSSFCSD
jgi:hypothetical protein